MKKIINAKLEEAKQFNSTILENIKEAIPISNAFLASTKKATDSLEKSKKSFSNVKNSSNETKALIDELIKANNDYTANPTAEKLKLINEKRSTLLYKINLNYNNAKIFSRDVLILQNDMFKNIETMKEFLPTLKNIKVYINKLNLTYLKINQLTKIKKTIKLTRQIFETTPNPNCKNEINDKRRENSIAINDCDNAIKITQNMDMNKYLIDNYEMQYKELNTFIKKEGAEGGGLEKSIIKDTEDFNNEQNKLVIALNELNELVRNFGNQFKIEKAQEKVNYSNSRQYTSLENIEDNLRLQTKYGVGKEAVKNAKAFLKLIISSSPEYTPYTLEKVRKLEKEKNDLLKEAKRLEDLLKECIKYYP